MRIRRFGEKIIESKYSNWNYDDYFTHLGMTSDDLSDQFARLVEQLGCDLEKRSNDSIFQCSYYPPSGKNEIFLKINAPKFGKIDLIELELERIKRIIKLKNSNVFVKYSRHGLNRKYYYFTIYFQGSKILEKKKFDITENDVEEHFLRLRETFGCGVMIRRYNFPVMDHKFEHKIIARILTDNISIDLEEFVKEIERIKRRIKIIYPHVGIKLHYSDQFIQINGGPHRECQFKIIWNDDGSKVKINEGGNHFSKEYGMERGLTKRQRANEVLRIMGSSREEMMDIFLRLQETFKSHIQYDSSRSREEVSIYIRKKNLSEIEDECERVKRRLKYIYPKMNVDLSIVEDPIQKWNKNVDKVYYFLLTKKEEIREGLYDFSEVDGENEFGMTKSEVYVEDWDRILKRMFPDNHDQNLEECFLDYFQKLEENFGCCIDLFEDGKYYEHTENFIYPVRIVRYLNEDGYVNPIKIVKEIEFIKKLMERRYPFLEISLEDKSMISFYRFIYYFNVSEK